MDLRETHIKEFFELFPKNLQYLGDIEHEKIFSNETIINYVYTWLSRHKSTYRLDEPLKDAIEKNIIMIGFLKKGSVPFLFRKMKNIAFSKFNQSFVAAFYSKEEKKIAVILDQNTNILGYAIFPIPVILMHEICHMCGHINNTEYLRKVTLPFLYPFYKYILNKIEPKTLMIPKEELIKTIIRISREMDSDSGNGSIQNIYLMWYDYFNMVVNDATSEFLATNIIGTFLRNIEGTNNNISEHNANTITELIYKSYEKLGVKNSRKLMVGQELVIPSEVVCVCNQWTPSSQIISLVQNTIQGISK